MGLLDRLSNFNINNKIASSLLPASNSGGLLDPQTAEAIQQQALTAGAVNLLQNSGPSTTPRTTMQNIGSAVDTGQQAQMGLTSQALQNQLLRSQALRNLAAAEAPPSGTNSYSIIRQCNQITLPLSVC